ncbi:substrate-binding domain-containing protein [Isoptericola aurantiacus]|uniref:substrate-binding domain-containing protein n=1 Tax=Isoptericola aurantiacus TaxID=3377839 RepID=UPI00383A5BAD
MSIRSRRAASAVVAAGVLAAVLTACGTTGADDADADGTVALLLPEAQTARYETTDRPTFEDVAGRRCPGCTLLYANAGEDAARQQEQADAMIARGADVLVLDAVDATAAVSIVAEAERHGVGVVAYDRFIDDPRVDYYVTFDYEVIGYQQGRALLASLVDDGDEPDLGPGSASRPGILLVNGSPTDPNAAELSAGVHRALDGTDVEILAEYDTPGWSPTRAQEWVSGQYTQFGGHVHGVAAANDALAGGAIAALKAAGADPVPPVTGQDAELAAVQRVVDGDQLMTVAKAHDQQARTAAEVAVRLLRGETPVASSTIGGIKSFVLAPTPVWADDVQRVIVDGRVHTVEEICTPAYAASCARLGLTEEGAP